jgi:hypothetical protein
MLRLPCLFILPCLLLLAVPAQATQGHVLAKGIIYQAATYINHPRFGTHPSYYGNRPEQVADINIGSTSGDDDGMPLFAPEDGTVVMIHHNTNAWGYSIEWRNLAGTERLFMAHLKSVAVMGAVRAGEKIAEIGGTGGWHPHLHIESATGWLVLSGSILQPPINPYGNGMLYVSNGPADTGGIATGQPFVPKEPRQQAARGSMELGGGATLWRPDFNIPHSTQN